MLRKGRLVIAETDDQLRLVDRGLVGGNPFTQGLEQAGNIGDLAIRRREQVGGQGLQSAHQHMAVRVDETGHQRAALEVDHLGLGAFQLHHLGAGADSDDGAIVLGNRLDAHRFVFHGEDGAAVPDPVGGLGHRPRAGRQHQGCGGDAKCAHGSSPCYKQERAALHLS
jgi:hypothetical protein